jgi:hypothetical protein
MFRVFTALSIIYTTRHINNNNIYDILLPRLQSIPSFILENQIKINEDINPYLRMNFILQ